MQFIEATIIGARSARLSFASSTNPARVTLFPMIHVGEAEFYAETYADAKGHDVVLLEGVRSPITTRVTRSYRWIEGARGLSGLMVQPRFPNVPVGPKLVHADLSRAEFESEWRKVPLWMRLVVYVLAPLVGLRRRWRYSRSKLAKEMSCEDQPSLAEMLAMSPESGALTHAIMDARDERLIECLRAEIDAPRDQPKNIAVVYGAMHMRAVVRELTLNRDFIVRTSEWRTILHAA